MCERYFPFVSITSSYWIAMQLQSDDTVHTLQLDIKGTGGVRTVFSLRFSAADSLKETPLRKCEPICTGMVGSSHWMG